MLHVAVNITLSNETLVIAILQLMGFGRKSHNIDLLKTPLFADDIL